MSLGDTLTCRKEMTAVLREAMYMFMKELEALTRALDEWEAADDRANEAAAALSSPARLPQDELEEIRALQEAAAEKLEALRLLVDGEFVPSGF